MFALALPLAGLAACSHTMIPNTTVEDTAENREIIEFLEGYRRAVERGDSSSLLALASERYYHHNGTPGTADDVDYTKLRERLAGLEDALADARYEIRYRNVAFEETGGVTEGTAELRVLVDYTYSASFRLGDHWERRVRDHRIVLAREDGEYRIVSGM